MTASLDVYLNHVGMICALGSGTCDVKVGLFSGTPGGVQTDSGLVTGKSLSLGIVRSTLSSLDALPANQHSRNNALLLTALAQIRPQVDHAINLYGSHRIAVVLGTSTSGIGEAEQAIAQHVASGSLSPAFHVCQQELGSPAIALSKLLGISGPAMVISTACSSSAKAMASAGRLLSAGIVDAVITGGMDALCEFTIAGFSALESVSAERCNPMSVNRKGINIGEGGALFLMTREPGPVSLAGWGESSDAHHISAPAPDGLGALAAMRKALQRARIAPEEIDYVNLHGTATPQNDSMESLAVHEIFGTKTAASSTKPLTGHTLGGAGALEAALCWITLVDNPTGRLPPHWWDGQADLKLAPLRLVQANESLGRQPKYALSNSFAFGGNNASLILKRT